jgi:hypothetical protein
MNRCEGSTYMILENERLRIRQPGRPHAPVGHFSFRSSECRNHINPAIVFSFKPVKRDLASVWRPGRRALTGSWRVGQAP